MYFSKILLKLIDQAIVPAIVLLTIRLGSVLIISMLFGLNITFGNNGFTFQNHAEYLFTNTYSIFAMVLVLFIALFYTLVQSFVFHDTHIKPGLTAKLFTLKIATFIKGSFDLYSKATVWLLYAYLVTIVVGGMAYFNAIEVWVFYVTLALTIISSVLLVIDVDNELHINNNDEVVYDTTARNLLEESA